MRIELPQTLLARTDEVIVVRVIEAQANCVGSC
jgi:hypothetical protein